MATPCRWDGQSLTRTVGLWELEKVPEDSGPPSQTDHVLFRTQVPQSRCVTSSGRTGAAQTPLGPWPGWGAANP